MSPDQDRSKLESVQRLCRLCAGCNGPWISIFSGEGETRCLAGKIHTLLPIMVSSDDWLPQRVCLECVSALDISHSLFNACVEADIKLRAMMGVCQAASPKLDACLEAVSHWVDLKAEGLSQSGLLSEMDIAAVEHIIMKPQNIGTNSEKGDLGVRQTSHSIEHLITSSALVAGLVPTSTDVHSVLEGSTSSGAISLGDPYLDIELTVPCVEQLDTMQVPNKTCSVQLVPEGEQNSTSLIKNDKDSSQMEEILNSAASDESIFKCDECGFVALNIKNMRQHLSTKHPELKKKSKKYPCQHCPEILKSSTRLKEHEFRHTGERPYVCEFCGKSYRVARSLMAHRVQHDADARVYSCSLCNKSFTSRGGFKDHMALHSSHRLQCDICGKALKSRSGLSKHKKLHIEPEERLSFPCQLCNKISYTKQMLEEHQRTHTGEKPFVCNTCGKRFAIRKTLRNHQATHSSQRNHVCDICGYRSSRRDNLAVHLRTHSK